MKRKKFTEEQIIGVLKEVEPISAPRSLRLNTAAVTLDFTRPNPIGKGKAGPEPARRRTREA